MPDPNARRDKALENIAGSLSDIARLLKQIEKNTRRTKFVNYPERPDPFDAAQMAEEAPVVPDADKDQFPQPSHPYLRRSPSPVETEGTNAIE